MFKTNSNTYQTDFIRIVFLVWMSLQVRGMMSQSRAWWWRFTFVGTRWSERMFEGVVVQHDQHLLLNQFLGFLEVCQRGVAVGGSQDVGIDIGGARKIPLDCG